MDAMTGRNVMIKPLGLVVAATLSLNCSPAVTLERQISNAPSLAASPPAAALSNNLRARIEQISGEARGRVGAAVTIIETGESISFNGGERFPMQSVYKLPIGMAALRQIDNGTLSLEQRVRVEQSDFVGAHQHSPIRDRNPRGTELSVGDLLRFMVSESDGTACDVLLRLIGGPEFVMSYLRDLNLNDVIVANTEKEIGRDESVQYRNWATPEAMLVLLRALHEGRGLSAQSRALLLRLMTETPTGQRRIKGRLPDGTIVAHKTGTSNTINGLTAATNDVGLVTLPDGRHLAVAVFVSDARAETAAREDTIAQIARAAWDWSAQFQN